MPTTWTSLKRVFFSVVSFKADDLRINHPVPEHFSSYTSVPLASIPDRPLRHVCEYRDL